MTASEATSCRIFALIVGLFCASLAGIAGVIWLDIVKTALLIVFSGTAGFFAMILFLAAVVPSEKTP